ncbi:ABC transporter permease [Parolsenella catena]|uniref:ABC transporter permease n=1 Tax=Parolsenella catena TaxID=2003188 RepID=UPI00189BCDD1|nr:ABC transporter permease [Parolsenella catena]
MTPLARRLPRELKHNLGKYLGIFLLMCGSIALTSGFLLAAHSIGCLIDGMRDEYAIEDGRVTTSFEATDAQAKAAEDAAEGVGGVTLYKNFSIDAAIKKPAGDDGTKRTLRTYAHRTEVDLASYCEGAEPRADDEVAIDRVFATNNGLAVGDTVELEGRAYTICGIMTQPDSQALFLDNSDFTINTVTYGVAEVTDTGFAALEDAGGAPTYTYSFVFNNRGLSVADRTDAEKDMVDALMDADARVDDLIDADSNQGIGYARDDVDGDSVMWTTLLDIIIVIMAFVFVVLTDSTIEEESAIIGTLLASGYRKREIVLHYLTLPAIVGILAALLGTALGVSVFTEPMRSLYYGSYSLPPFHVFWSWEIFVKCAVVPAAALILITLAGLLRKMGKTPLQFLRHEAGGKSGTKRGLRLPERMGFVSRFRLRVFLRNLGNFATLFVGIAFASLLLLFGLAILPTMTHYADNLETSLVAAHQYTLKAPLELEGTAEEREQWAALDRLQSVDGALLTAAEDAQDELDDAADAAQAAADAVKASPSVEGMQAANDALEKVQDKKDALYARLDDIADALGCDRDEIIDLIDGTSDIDADNDDIHPVNTTDNGAEKIAQAEKYAVYQLQYDRGEGNGVETVTIYGVSPDSRYWKGLGVGDGRVVFGRGLLDKFGWRQGQKVGFHDKYEDKDYSFEYAGNDSTWGSKSDMNVYMSIDDFNELFGNDPSYFNGYVSDEELDLDSRYFAGDTTPDDMRAVGDQFIGMMSDLIGMMVGLSVFIFLLFMYLLTKAVIDRGARSISYMKVFGYRDGEISHLYIRSITLCVMTALLLSQPVIIGSLTAIFRSMLLAYNGNIEIYVPWWSIAACVGIGFATYLVVALLHTRSIRRVSLSEALKVQE